MNNNLEQYDNTLAMTQQSTGTSANRELARIQGEIFMAKRFPRNEAEAIKKIVDQCGRLRLAEQSTYQYAKGGSDISGPSIRLLEVCAQNWQNIRYGWEIIEQYAEYTHCRAYAYDVQTNTQAERVFDVRHWIDTKSGGRAPNDARELYELCANMASRRVRACLQQVIPGDVIDEAIDACKRTVNNSVKLGSNGRIPPETISKMKDAFRAYGVTPEQLDNFVQRPCENMTAGQYVRLRRIYTSLKDGVATASDFFKSSADLSQGNAAIVMGMPVETVAPAAPEEPAQDQMPVTAEEFDL